jgi:acyl-CoA ligase (AMP-forming) (exosortase A-associated)
LNTLIHDLPLRSADHTPDAPALRWQGTTRSYSELAEDVRTVGRALLALGLSAGDRVAVYLPKQPETVIALFAAAWAGCVFVPVNPVLKRPQLQHILQDSGARVLISTRGRRGALAELAASCPALRHVVDLDKAPEAEAEEGLQAHPWAALLSGAGAAAPHRRIDGDVAALLYTSGSTGRPKGVVLSHRNLVAGAESVATYLGNHAEDRLLAALPLSFDYGLSQLTTAFRVGASVTLLDYLLPRDVLRALERDAITGLAGVPPLWMQLAELDWPEAIAEHLRYVTNSGGRMPRELTRRLREKLPRTQVFLMYGLTEAFRSTYLDPAELDRRPESIGKAIPNADVRVLRPDGSEAAPGETGELVHRGALVSLGYWNDPERTAQRFRPVQLEGGRTTPDLAVWSGDLVRRDEEGFLYFVSRNDEMIKSSGYRVSPTEVEEVLFALPGVTEAVAVGLPDPQLGEAIAVAVVSGAQGLEEAAIRQHCARELPNFMQPRHLALLDKALPRNQNGKIDRLQVRTMLTERFLASDAPSGAGEATA